MKYKLLIIIGSVVLLTGCGQVQDFSTNEIIHQPVDEPVNELTAEEKQQVQLEARMLAEHNEPSFEEMLKIATKDENGNIILTSQMRYAFPGCKDIDAGLVEPNTSIKYENIDRGISFRIPYNSAWKFCGYVLDKYDTIPTKIYYDWETIEFGGLQLMPESGSNLARLYHLAFMPTSTPERLMSENRNQAFRNEAGIEFSKMKINNLEVLKEVEDGGLCSSVSYYIFTDKNTFAFQGYCVNMSIGGKEYSKEQFSKELEKIIETVKLI